MPQAHDAHTMMVDYNIAQPPLSTSRLSPSHLLLELHDDALGAVVELPLRVLVLVIDKNRGGQSGRQTDRQTESRCVFRVLVIDEMMKRRE